MIFPLENVSNISQFVILMSLTAFSWKIFKDKQRREKKKLWRGNDQKIAE